MDHEDLAARSDELRASARALIEGSVALRAYSATLRRRHPRMGASERNGGTAVPREAEESRRAGAKPDLADVDGRAGTEPEAVVTAIPSGRRA